LNPVHAWMFLCNAVCITGMINHIFISFSAVQIYDLSYIHLHTFNLPTVATIHDDTR